MDLPRILFVLGKGGVGRSTVATALGLSRAQEGERVLVFEWTIAEPIGPWFGFPPVGTTPREVAPGLSVMTYALDEALRAYFVDHLHLPRIYRRVVRGAAVRRLVEAAPGFAELLFLGSLWWLTTLAPKEAGLSFDRIVVDAPATGHGASILDMPETLRALGAAGLLAKEIARVTQMMRDPAWTGAILVAAPEELAVEETLELAPRVTRAMGRPPLRTIVNRSAARFVSEDAPWLGPFTERFSPGARDALRVVHAELARRARFEAQLRDALGDVRALDDQLLAAGASTPLEVARALARAGVP